MGKLHELLAVEPELKMTAKKTIESVVKSFSQAQRFIGHSKIYRPLEEDGHTFPDEIQPMASTVSDELKRVRETLGPWIDASIQKEAANQAASEAENIGDKEFVLPATAWLNLEEKLEILKKIIKDIPVNDPSTEWEWDGDTGRFRSAPMITYRTEKVVEAIVGYPATDEHPAQVQWVPKDVRVGESLKTLYSGMISVHQKRVALQRADQLLMNVKKARQRANQVEVPPVHVADAIFHYIFQD